MMSDDATRATGKMIRSVASVQTLRPAPHVRTRPYDVGLNREAGRALQMRVVLEAWNVTEAVLRAARYN